MCIFRARLFPEFHFLFFSSTSDLNQPPYLVTYLNCLALFHTDSTHSSTVPVAYVNHPQLNHECKKGQYVVQAFSSLYEMIHHRKLSSLRASREAKRRLRFITDLFEALLTMTVTLTVCFLGNFAMPEIPFYWITYIICSSFNTRYLCS